MTINQMDDVIQDYCNGHGNSCGSCAIKAICDPVDGDFRKHEDACREAYEFIMHLQKTQPDNVNHPQHYETGKYECIDVMVEAIGLEDTKGFCLCNAFKYIYRCTKKHNTPVEDVKKAIWYLNKFLELEG